MTDAQSIAVEAQKYRKTALVEAEQFLPNEGKIPAGVYSSERADPRKNGLADWMLKTLEGAHVLRNGDYICTGPNGEKWNVERAIFEATYEAVEDAAMPAPSDQEKLVGELVEALERIGNWADIGPNARALITRARTQAKGAAS